MKGKNVLDNEKNIQICQINLAKHFFFSFLGLNLEEELRISLFRRLDKCVYIDHLNALLEQKRKIEMKIEKYVTL